MYYVQDGGGEVNLSVPWDLCPNPWQMGNPQLMATARQGYSSVSGLRTHSLPNDLPKVPTHGHPETEDAAGHMQWTQTLPVMFRSIIFVPYHQR